MPYSKLYILAELSANDVKIISVDSEKLDLSKYIYIGTENSIFVEIQPYSTNIKNDPRKCAHINGLLSHLILVRSFSNFQQI